MQTSTMFLNSTLTKRSAAPIRYKACLGWLGAFVLLAALLSPRDSYAQGDIIWSTEVTTTTINTTTAPDYNFTEDGVDVTISYAFSSTAPSTYLGSYYETRTDQLGQEFTYLGMQMNATTDNGSQWLRTTFVFDPGINDLSMTFLDVDLQSNSWRDILVITASNSGGNVAPTATVLGGSSVEGPTSNGDCSTRNTATTPCFRGISGNVGGTSNASNVTVSYVGSSVTQVIVHYISGNAPGVSNPDGQRIGIGDISWQGVLPVELTSFTVQADGTDAILAWETASETNNAGFYVEHAPGDEQTFTQLAFVEGNGTTLLPQRYRHRIDNLDPGRHIFRLKQIDYDGTFEYHPEVEVVLEMAEHFIVEPVYPNPFNPEARLRFAVQRSQPIEVSLHDVLGRRVSQLYSGVASAGQLEEVYIDGQGLPSGVYVVRVQGARFLETQVITLAK